MSRRIYIKDGGLTSSFVPDGYTALGSENGELKIKIGDTTSNVVVKSYKSYVALLSQTTTVLSPSALTLEVGKTYCILYLEVGDDFSNVGYVSNGVPFVATDDTPNVWVIPVGGGTPDGDFRNGGTIVTDMDDSQPSTIILEDSVSLTNTYLTPIFIEDERGPEFGVYNLFIIFEKEGEFLINKTFMPNTTQGLTRLNDNQLSINIGAAERFERANFLNSPIEFKIYN
jgi:hypothetical protein